MYRWIFMGNKLRISKKLYYVLLSIGLALVFLVCERIHFGLNIYTHTIIESFSFFSAILIGILAFMHYYNNKENSTLFIAVAFLGAGIFDFNHILFTFSQHIITFHSSINAIFQWSGAASRIFLALLLCFSFFGWEMEQKLGKAGRLKENAVYFITILSVILVFLMLMFIHLPSGYGSGLIISRGEEIIPAFFFLLALILYLNKGQWTKNNIDHWVILSLITSIFACLYMLFSKHLFDSLYVMSHFLKLFSYDFILIGFFISVYNVLLERQSHSLLKTTLNNLPFMAWLKDEEGRFKIVNEPYAEACNLSIDEIIGKTDLDIWSKELAEDYRADDFEIMKTEKRKTIEENIIFQGKARWSETYKTPVFDKNGKVIGTTGIARDITEKKEAENKLLFKDKLLSAVAEATNELVKNLDFDKAIIKAFKVLGNAVNVDRVYIFNGSYNAEKDMYFMCLKHEWVSDPAYSLINTPLLQNIPFKPADYLISQLLEGKPNIINRKNTPFQVGEFLDSMNIVTMLNFPIFINDRFWGLVGLDECNENREWSEAEKSVLFSFAALLAGVIERKEAEIELLQRQKEIIKANDREVLLRKIITTIRSSLDIDETLRIICEEVAKLFQVQRVIIAEFPNKDNYGEWHARKEYKTNSEIKGLKDIENAKNSLTYNATVMLEQEMTLVIDNISSCDAPDYFKMDYESLGIKSNIATGIKRENDKWGLISLSEYESYRHWTKEDIILLETIADQIYVAIKHAQLYSTIEENERLLHFTLDSMIDGHIATNSDGIIQSCNPSAEYIFGYKTAELKSKSIDDLFVQKFFNLEENFKNELEYSNEKFELSGIRKNRSIIPLKISVSEIYYNGEIYCSFIINDVSKEKEVERMKNEFISTVSHELRTPLTSIRGALGLVSSGVTGELSEKSKELLDIANNNSSRLINLINDILDIEKIEAGKMDFNIETFEIMPIIEQAIKTNATYAEQFNVKFKIDQSLPDAKVKVDKNRIIQVITNLLSNAAKFSRSSETIDISVIRQNNNIRVSVTNYGYSIPEEFKSRIFTKFAQADSSSTRQKGGTGLGLSICKAIIEKMGGTIEFTTEAETSTTFYFDLPEFHLHPSKITYKGYLDIPHILICEDDKDIALLINMLLKQENYASDVAYSADQAKKLLSKNNYDALILDLILPDQNGIELIKELREQERNYKLPIVVVSIKAEEGKKEIGQHFGIMDWINKPIEEIRLLNAVKLALTSPHEDIFRILHVEDDIIAQKLVYSILKKDAYISQAANLETAKKTLENGLFDLVLIDLDLPDGNGAELITIINKNKENRTAIVIFSSYEVDENITHKVDAIIPKSKEANIDLLDIVNFVKERKKNQ